MCVFVCVCMMGVMGVMGVMGDGCDEGVRREGRTLPKEPFPTTLMRSKSSMLILPEVFLE